MKKFNFICFIKGMVFIFILQSILNIYSINLDALENLFIKIEKLGYASEAYKNTILYKIPELLFFSNFITYYLLIFGFSLIFFILYLHLSIKFNESIFKKINKAIMILIIFFIILYLHTNCILTKLIGDILIIKK